MESTPLNLLCIVVDEALRHAVENDLTDAGARGYTVSHAEGKGKTGERSDHWTGTNVKIETLVAAHVLEKILGKLKEKYFDRYPMIAYFHEVQVTRLSHFTE